ELEAMFRGAGWNVIKVIWGSRWDELLQRDVDGALLNKMNTTLDGEYQRYAVEDGGYAREKFFGPDPRLRKLVEHLSDDEIRSLPRGGHDFTKLFAAYTAATEHEGAPTVILAKTVKGWTLGKGFEGRNATHQIKKMNQDQLVELRKRLHLEDVISDRALEADEPPFYRPPSDSPEYEYLMNRRRALDGFVPRRTTDARRPLTLPSDDPFEQLAKGSATQAVSTTMAFTRLLRDLMRDPAFGPRVVPIVPDEARTFGMDSMFREFRIYASEGQLYEPVDHELLLSYSEGKDGQILEEGITEAGSLASFTAAGTSYATQGVPMVPFYTFYSMFGFQRVGDLIWAAADARARGFLLGATAGRTTLQGEGLQHQDGHSLLLASSVPTCEAYDPAFAYELAILIRDGLHRMYGNGEDVFYYITLYNENYLMPAAPEGVADGVVEGLYRWRAAPPEPTTRATLLFSGAAWVCADEAARELAERWGVALELWSATSYKRLREDALSVERWNRLHPDAPPRTPRVTELLHEAPGPIVAVTDFMKAIPDQIARWVPRSFLPLGTDGFGRSDARPALRHHFEIDAGHIVVAVLSQLADDGQIDRADVVRAIEHYDIDPDSVDPRLL
ncbi:MAG: pyruvate dehydrogenase (acetyl-transferring), homodimeric type, partial [Acidimicrobiales bacterium]